MECNSPLNTMYSQWYCGENVVRKAELEWNRTSKCISGFESMTTNNQSCMVLNEINDPSNVTFVPLDYVNFDLLVFLGSVILIMDH